MEKGCPPLHGLRHLALRVRDIRRAKDFYQRIFNMKIVWEPDPQNCYLSSGTDNLALHEAPAPGNPARGGRLGRVGEAERRESSRRPETTPGRQLFVLPRRPRRQ